MSELITRLVKYVLKNYPYKSELSASRLTKIIYLADWKSAIDYSDQLTSIKWHFDHYGPYVEDVMDSIKKDPTVIVESTSNIYGSKKTLIALKENAEDLALTTRQRETLDFVIEATKNKNYSDFIKLVYSTYPVVIGNRYSDMDLVSLAKIYKEMSVAHQENSA
jgi:uncharacterized protein YwgA